MVSHNPFFGPTDDHYRMDIVGAGDDYDVLNAAIGMLMDKRHIVRGEITKLL